MKDNIYQHPQNVVDFSFDHRVADVFPDMIKRSVPGYGTIIKATGLLAQRFVQAQTRCYDLGCSLGASTLAVCEHLSVEAEIIAVDNASAMLERCQQVLKTAEITTPVQTQLADICDIPIENASFVILNFTLQFVPLEQRKALLETIYKGLLPGGALILSEKMKLPSSTTDQLFSEIHHDFKRAQGYSDLEIAQKRNAIENVLIPETLEAHTQRLKQAGFKDVAQWFQCFNFASVVAIK